MPKSGWLSVHKNNDEWMVLPADISFTKNAYGLTEIWSSVPDTEFIIHGGDIKQGPVVGASKLLNPVSSIVYRGKTYLLSRANDSNSLMLTTDEKIWRLDWIEGNNFRVEWAGDLDGDSELDLYIESDLARGLYLSRDKKITALSTLQQFETSVCGRNQISGTDETLKAASDWSADDDISIRQWLLWLRGGHPGQGGGGLRLNAARSGHPDR